MTKRPMAAMLNLALLLAAPAMACVWEGGTTKVIPRVVELHHGCCDNEGNYLLVIGSLKINLHTPIHMSAFGIFALAGISASVRLVKKRRRNAANQMQNTGTSAPDSDL